MSTAGGCCTVATFLRWCGMYDMLQHMPATTDVGMTNGDKVSKCAFRWYHLRRSLMGSMRTMQKRHFSPGTCGRCLSSSKNGNQLTAHFYVSLSQNGGHHHYEAQTKRHLQRRNPLHLQIPVHLYEWSMLKSAYEASWPWPTNPHLHARTGCVVCLGCVDYSSATPTLLITGMHDDVSCVGCTLWNVCLTRAIVIKLFFDNDIIWKWRFVVVTVVVSVWRLQIHVCLHLHV